MVVKTSMDAYRQTLAGFIQDDDRLVTYKWLSKELEVHVNTAKEILADYWETHKNDGIVATFLLIGNTKDGGKRIEVVKGDDLEKAKERYETVTSEHLYSLQRELSDLEALASAGAGDSKFGAIKSKECVILTNEEVHARRWGAGVVYDAPHDGSKLEPRIITKKEPVNALKKAFSNAKPAENKENNKEKSKESGENETKTDEAKKEVKTEAKKVSPPGKSGDKKGAAKKPVQSTKTGFNALFGKAQNQKKSPPTSNGAAAAKTSPEASKSSSETKKSVETSKTSSEASKKEEKVDDLMDVDFGDDFDEDFQKKPTKKSPNDSKSSQKDKKTTSKNKSSHEEKSTSKKKSSETEEESLDAKKSSSEDKKPTTNGTSKPEKSKKAARGKKRGRSRDPSEDAKKRKRILVVSDSSDESDQEEADPLGALEAEEVTEVAKSPSPPPVRKIGGKRKVQKMVDKTIVDDDGYMVTKKVQVMESCSEDEEPPKEKEKEKKPSPPKETSKVKKNNKQTSIMNFFKKA